MEYIIIDGYFSGTGIRDKYNGGYILPESLNLSPALIDKLKKWLTKYESEFFNQYSDSESSLQGMHVSGRSNDSGQQFSEGSGICPPYLSTSVLPAYYSIFPDRSDPDNRPLQVFRRSTAPPQVFLRLRT